jgi:hypothetical protein
MNIISLFTIRKWCLLFFREHLNQFRIGKGFVWVVSDYFPDPLYLFKKTPLVQLSILQLNENNLNITKLLISDSYTSAVQFLHKTSPYFSHIIGCSPRWFAINALGQTKTFSQKDNISMWSLDSTSLDSWRFWPKIK